MYKLLGKRKKRDFLHFAHAMRNRSIYILRNYCVMGVYSNVFQHENHLGQVRTLDSETSFHEAFFLSEHAEVASGQVWTVRFL